MEEKALTIEQALDVVGEYIAARDTCMRCNERLALLAAGGTASDDFEYYHLRDNQPTITLKEAHTRTTFLDRLPDVLHAILKRLNGEEDR